MASLVHLAAKEADAKSKAVAVALDTVFENMNDIKMYIDANLDRLPEKGEVSVTELLSLLGKISKLLMKLGRKLLKRGNGLRAY